MLSSDWRINLWWLIMLIGAAFVLYHTFRDAT